MRYIYLDLGAYDGDTITGFVDSKDLPVEASKFEIFAFEPNPKFTHKIKLLQASKNFTFYPKAVWTENGTKEFAVDPTKTPLGSTLMKEKRKIWEISEKVKVDTVKFSEFIKQFEGDYVVVKMDVEGAEFPILEQMIEEKTDFIMNQLWVEMHPSKVEGYTTEYANELIKRLHCKVVLWH